MHMHNQNQEIKKVKCYLDKDNQNIQICVVYVLQRPTENPRWQKPLEGRFKCNIDASFSRHLNRIGIGMCIRDDSGTFVLAKTEWISHLCDVHVGESSRFIIGFRMGSRTSGPIDFELDAKRVVTTSYPLTMMLQNLEVLSITVELFLVYIMKTLVWSLFRDKQMRLPMY
jgi:hypothetical protein